MEGSLNRHQVRGILEYLDDALVDLREADRATRFGGESNATWRVRLARDRLLDAAIRPITVELQEAA